MAAATGSTTGPFAVTFPFFDWKVTPEGGYVLTFDVADNGDPSAGHHGKAVVVLHPGGTVSVYRLDPTLGTGPVFEDATGALVQGRDYDPTLFVWRSWVRLQPQG